MAVVLLLAWLCLAGATVWFCIKRNWPVALLSAAATLIFMASLQFLM